MKRKNHLFQSCVSLLLALCMVIGYIPFTALAAGENAAPAVQTSGIQDVNGDGKISYVSFGDSVTNGYGMEGYRYEDGTNVYGFLREPEACYPVLIRNYLQDQGYEVALKQMAISGFRMDELHWMLCDCYEPDEYHHTRYGGWNRSVINRMLQQEDGRAYLADYIKQYGSDDAVRANADSIISAEYRKAVAEADLITIDLGTNNFGTFLTSTIQYILGLSDTPVTVDFSVYVDENTAASLDSMLAQMACNMAGLSQVPASGENQAYDLILTLARCLMYGYLGFTYHFDASLDAVYEINPNAQVVVVDMYTMISGVDLVGEALGDSIDLDQLYDLFIDLANYYSRELSPYAHKVNHATLDGNPELFIDYYKDYPDASYPENQYLHPSAERLMNEFIMEMMGYDPDEPAERDQFNEDILNNIKLLDSYVNNLQATVDEQVISGVIKPQIKENLDPVVEQVQTAIDGVETAQDAVNAAVEGVATAESAVDAAVEGVAAAEAAVAEAKSGVEAAQEAVNTAVDGVALAQSIVDMLVTNLIDHGTYGSMFEGSSTSSMIKSIIIGEIETYITDEIMVQAGFEPTEENKAALAEEAYVMACVYKDTLNSGGTREEANRLAIIEGLSYMLAETQGYSESEAEATAILAYELNAIYQTSGEAAAVKAAIETQVDDAMMEKLNVTTKADAAALIYAMGTADSDEAAIKIALQTQVTDELLEQFGMTGTDKADAADIIYTLGTADRDTAIKTALMLKVDEATADQAIALNAIYEESGFDAAVKAALMTQVDEDTADQALALYAVYQNALNNGADEDAAFDATVVFAMVKVGGYEQTLAEAIYAVYTETATADQEALANVTLMVNAGIPEATAKAIYTCYATNLDGQFNNENVQTTMIYFMVTAKVAADKAEAAELYDQYLLYKNLPTTLSKIAKCPTIYFDALLSAASDSESTGNLLESIAAKFMAGTLKLDEPAADASAEEWAEYKSDSALATLYFRFMAQDGVFTHPSEEGQEMLADVVKAALTNLNVSAPDSEIPNNADTKVLVLGDNIAASSDDSYADQLDGLLNGDVTKLAYEGFRINEVLALLDDAYAGDEYTSTILGSNQSALSTAYQSAVSGSDVVVVNLGAMNMGFLAAQLGLYNETNGQDTYSMEFTTVGSMDVFSTYDPNGRKITLGENVDNLLEQFGGAFQSGGVTPVSMLMLSLETYGYGYTTFVDCLDSTVEAIKALNPDAQVVLVGQYDLVGGAIFYHEETGMYLEMGDFIGHALNLMNEHMETYAAMNADVTYVDVTGTEKTGSSEGVNMASTDLSKVFADAMPSTNGHASMAQKISCHLGGHIPANEASITWTWNEDHTSCTAGFDCVSCGSEDVVVPADISAEGKEPTCSEAGLLTYTASVMLGGKAYSVTTGPVDHDALGHQMHKTEAKDATCSETGNNAYHTCANCEKIFKDESGNTETTVEAETLPIKAHAYTAPTFKWSDDRTTCTAEYSCTVGGETYSADCAVTTESVTADCVTPGKVTHTATVTIGENTYTDTKVVDGEALGHTYGEPVWNWAGDHSSAEAVFTCSVCDETTDGHTIAVPAEVTHETTEATCTTEGKSVYTASVQDGKHTDVKEVVHPATGHDFGEDDMAPNCGNCGEANPNAHPVCAYTVAETLVSGGTYILALGGTQVGEYTFAEYNGGWTIQAPDATYLAIENKTLTNSASPFVWTYADNRFSAEVKSSFNGWFGNWWGSSRTTYYLVANGSAAAISKSSNGAEATFYTAHSDTAHVFDNGVITAPACTADGHTTYTCTRCGYSYTTAITPATGHSYTAVVTAPTCTAQGYTTHTCSACGDSYVDSYVDAAGHNMVDGKCSDCGYIEGTVEPEPTPDADDCTYLQSVALTNGQLILTLGGNEVGTFTFTQVSGGWTIQTSDGTYLAFADNALTYSADAFVWTYSGNCFSTTVKSGSNNWWGGIFGNWWGSSETTYYLVSSGSAITTSTSSSNAAAAFYVQAVGEHVYGDPVASDGYHKFTCVNCGHVKSVACTDENCALCNPAATVNVAVKVTSKSSGGSWWEIIFGDRFGSKTYTASITVTAEGTEVSSVAYSTDGGNTWTEGTSFESSSNITDFQIRVICTNGVTYLFHYSNGSVNQIG